MRQKTIEGVRRKNIENLKGGDGKFESTGNLIGDKKGTGTENKRVFETLTHLTAKDPLDNVGGNVVLATLLISSWPWFSFHP